MSVLQQIVRPGALTDAGCWEPQGFRAAGGFRHAARTGASMSALAPVTDHATEYEAVYCGDCAGSGEGMADNTTCSTCGGEGEVWVTGDDDDDDGKFPEPGATGGYS